MAEARSAVSFSFHATGEDAMVPFYHEALRAVSCSDFSFKSWKKRIGRIKNRVINGVYPVSPASWFVTAAVVVGLFLVNIDVSFGCHNHLCSLLRLLRCEEPSSVYISWIFVSTAVWLLGVFAIRYTLKALLSYHGWMYESRGKISLLTKLWLGTLKVFTGRKPLLYSYQGCLPSLPVPALKDTMKRYLKSMRPLMDDEKYERMERLVKEFETGIGPRLQRYLVLKSWWATNYVSDWWEDYLYLSGRSPIMINSNYYGIDAVMMYQTNIQAARAANVVYSFLTRRRKLEREEVPPVMLNKTIPLCSWQHKRQFNIVRIPGIEKDTLVHVKDSRHIAVYHRGRYYKMLIHHKGELLKPCQIEIMLQQILDDTTSEPAPGECHLAALTAGDRVTWAKARESFFATGVNRSSLDTIEQAAFFLALDDEPQYYDKNDDTKYDRFCSSVMHGKGYDRWFDKPMTVVVSSNGRCGLNLEHSWADAPITARIWELVVHDDMRVYGYTEDGHTKGSPEFPPPNPVRLRWELNEECREVIEGSLSVAQALIDDLDLHILLHDNYGKGFIKRCKFSPDAYIQMALQLAYYRNAGKFCLTYEASMTRLFREGRTETVRSCTMESCAFVRAMDDPNMPKSEKISLLQTAGEAHQHSYRNAMTGRGIDRHLFALYVVSKYLNIESPFLKEVLSEPWRLSTSQTPHQQEDPELTCGGGFATVVDDGYGVSYIIANEQMIFFHVSSKKSCPLTDSRKFAEDITRALDDLRQLFL